MVLLKAAPRHAAGYALLEVGAASIRICLPNELAPANDASPRPAKRARLSGTSGAETASATGPGLAVNDGATSAVPGSGPDTQHAGVVTNATGSNDGSAVPAAPESADKSQIEVDDEPLSVHTSSRTGARVTSSVAAKDPADPDAPLLSMPNLIARGRGSEGAHSKRPGKRRIFVADQILDECLDRSSLQLRSPMERGFVTDWAAQKIIWDRAISVSLEGRDLAPRQPMPYTHAMAARTAKSTGVTADEVSWYEFGTDLQSRLLEERTAIVTEPYFNFPDCASAMDTLIFEQYGVAALWRVTPAQLVPFAPLFRTKTSPNADGARGLNSTGLSAPDCLLVVDLGHSNTTVVPLICAQAQWQAARRLDIGGKLLTNLLKETLSFRQWDVMDETWLVQAVKERCCFLASCSGLHVNEDDDGADTSVSIFKLGGPSKTILPLHAANSDTQSRRKNDILRLIRSTPPSQWGWTLLVELCNLFPASNPILQEYVLPDYSEIENPKKAALSELPQSNRALGYVRRGAGADSAIPRSPAHQSGTRRNYKEEDAIIADMSMSCERQKRKKKSGLASLLSSHQTPEEGDEGDEDEDDDDFDPINADRSSDQGSASSDEDTSRSDTDESADEHAGGREENAQVLTMGSERFSIPEVLFDPGRVGLAQAPLHETIAASIRACPADVRDMMWSNIVLVGGGAKLAGLRRRLEHELRSLAPEDAYIHFWECDEPEKAASHGALALLRARIDSPESRFFRAHLVNRTEWVNAGAAVCRARFGGWMATHDAAAHMRRGEGDEDDEGEAAQDAEDGSKGNGGVWQGQPGTSAAVAESRARFGPSTGPANARGKGRIVNRAQEKTASNAGADVTKRPRGRPKGSKNKPKQSA